MAWDWEWGEEREEVGSDVSVEDVESREQYNPCLQSESENSDIESISLSVPAQTHTVTFKCIISTHAQECPSKASKILRNVKDGTRGK